MNYLENWIDISKISQHGWSGSKVFDNTNHYLIFTATNGWRSFFWTIPDIKDKEICFEFDYKFTITDNWSNCWIINSNDYGYNSSHLVVAKNTEWTHYKVNISSTTQYIGINVRGVDNTGKSVVMVLKNIRLYLKDSSNNQVYKNGNCVSGEIIEDESFSVYPTSIYSKQMTET